MFRRFRQNDDEDAAAARDELSPVQLGSGQLKLRSIRKGAGPDNNVNGLLTLERAADGFGTLAAHWAR